MTQIKSEKAKEYIMSIVEPVPTPEGELVFYVEMTPLQVVTAIIIAETEAEERHAKELQELKDKAVYLFMDFVVDYAFEAGYTEIERNSEHYIKIFTQKLNEQ